ncbi:MAG: hypothetical protein ACRDSN_09625, partial [Pseudonocardiaceae bacterium]
MSPSGWAEVVYGRTFTADFWWRAVPSWADRHGWLGTVIRSVLGGGHGLGDQPRFVLARGTAGTLVGVACRARELSDSMHTDGQRPLFCFVGWLHPATERPVDVPSIAALEERFVVWAAPVYARWMAPVWQMHPSRLREPAVSTPERPPWVEPGSLGMPAGLSAQPGWVRLHPPERRSEVWAAAAGSTGEVGVVTGWGSYRDGVADAVTDACAADVGPDTPVVVELPRPKPRPVEPAPRRAATPVLEPPTRKPRPPRPAPDDRQRRRVREWFGESVERVGESVEWVGGYLEWVTSPRKWYPEAPSEGLRETKPTRPEDPPDFIFSHPAGPAPGAERAPRASDPVQA